MTFCFLFIYLFFISLTHQDTDAEPLGGGIKLSA